MFNVDFIELIKQNVPAKLCKTKLLAWIKALISPILQLHSDFTSYRAECDYFVNHTFQVIYLEKILNDIYDPDDRGIYIEDTPPIDVFAIYNSSEGIETAALYNSTESSAEALILYNESEVLQPQDFIIMIPSNVYGFLTTQQFTEMRALVNKFKFAGIRFNIEEY